MKNLIPAYYESYKDGYVENTTRANTKESVLSSIENYIADNVCNDEVISFLDEVVKNYNLLEKTHLVWDGSYRSCCVLVRPDGICQSGNYKIDVPKGVLESLNFYEDNAEIFFLNMTSQTWAEVNAEMVLFEDVYDYDCPRYYEDEDGFYDLESEGFMHEDDISNDDMTEAAIDSYVTETKNNGHVPYFTQFCQMYGHANNEDNLRLFERYTGTM